VIFDPHCITGADLQAMDRAHRMGQAKDVNVHRFIAKGTIEGTEYLRQMAKQQHANIAVDGSTAVAIVSVGQIYGDVLYYGTCYLENFIHSRPEALYFWGYFVVLNALWILIPLVMLLYAAKNINAAVASTSSKIKSR